MYHVMGKFALFFQLFLLSNLNAAEAQQGDIFTFAGQANTFGKRGSATAALIYKPTGIALSSFGDIIVVDRNGFAIRKVILWNCNVTVSLNCPSVWAIVFLFQVNSAGFITTVVGTLGMNGNNGDRGSAHFSLPFSVALASTGDIYISDSGVSLIKKVGKIHTYIFVCELFVQMELWSPFPSVVSQVNSVGVIATLVGGGTSLGDDGPATAAQLNGTQGIAVATLGDIYIADSNNNRIRMVTDVLREPAVTKWYFINLFFFSLFFLHAT